MFAYSFGPDSTQSTTRKGMPPIMKHVPKPWPSGEDVQLLADRFGGYFVYASTILKYVDEQYPSCIDRLQEIL